MALTATVGPVSARFAGKVKISDVEAPRAYTIRFEGTGGPAGFVNGEASVILTPGDAGSTTLSYAARAQVGGKLAQIGSRLIDGAAHKLTDEFFVRFVETMRPAVEAPAPAQARAQRWIPYVAIAAVVVAAAVVYLLVRRS
jgi:carbon monoxide dehydrogenase subunit G